MIRIFSIRFLLCVLSISMVVAVGAQSGDQTPTPTFTETPILLPVLTPVSPVGTIEFVGTPFSPGLAEFLTLMPDLDASSESQAVREYIASLGTVPYQAANVSRTELPSTDIYFDNVPYTVREQAVTMTRTVNRLQLVNAFEDVVWPGAVLQGGPLARGELSPVPLERFAGEITLTTDVNVSPGSDPITFSAFVESPSLATVRDARQNLIRTLDPQGGAGSVDYFYAVARTFEDALVRLGIQGSGTNWSFDINGSLSHSLTQNSLVVQYKQTYYTMTFTPTGSPPSFFAQQVSLSDLQNYMGVGNPPVYVSQVVYGRQLYLVMTGSASQQELRAAFQFAANGGVGAVGGYGEATLRSILESTSVRVVTAGTTAGTSALVLNPLQELPNYLYNSEVFTSNTPGVPIEMTLRHLSDGTGVPISLTTDFSEVFSVYSNPVSMTFEVGDGPSWGGVLNTLVPVAAGDQVTVSASGTVWSGIFGTGRHGPEGWIGWEAERNYPIPGQNPHQLIARVGAGPWIAIGAGTTFRSNQTGNLSFSVNDRNTRDGSGHFDLRVDIQRRTQDDLNLNGVGDTSSTG